MGSFPSPNHEALYGCQKDWLNDLAGKLESNKFYPPGKKFKKELCSKTSPLALFPKILDGETPAQILM